MPDWMPLVCPFPEPPCDDWGESGNGPVQVLEGQATWLYCPLFSHSTVYNYSSAQAAGLNLFWYHVPADQDLEQPLELSQRLSKERERLWLQPATAQDTGLYICVLSNKTSCTKIAMRLEVVPRGPGSVCEVTPSKNPHAVRIPLQGGETLTCPGVQDVRLNHSRITVTWYHCSAYTSWNSNREVDDGRLFVRIMLSMYAGNYYCVVNYESKGRAMNFSRMIKVTAVSATGLSKEPNILNPDKEKIYTVKQGSAVRLECRAFLPYLEGHGEMWWTVNGKTVEQFGDARFTNTSRVLKVEYEDRTEESVLHIKDFRSEDLLNEYNCSVRNNKGFDTRRAHLEEEAYLPSVELGCGLGVTLFLMLALFVAYHVFWLELLLLYRSWFGTDERSTDGKEYDIYISYARNSEEEQFVLLTLRRVLENELGYTVCIFDRDSLPGGNTSEAVFRFMQVSRRLLMVLSPDYLTEKSISLLECRLGLYLQHASQASIVTVLYKPVTAHCTEASHLRRAGPASAITWRGSQSELPRSRFWKRLRLALPVRPLALGRRLIDSTSSHSDLAALALQRQRTSRGSQRDGRGTAMGARGRGRPRRGPGRNGGQRLTCREGHGTSCVACARFREANGNLGVAVEPSRPTPIQQHQPSGDSPVESLRWDRITGP
ncbi:interleukin-1 receptor accessory protein [Aplochiton taeniatus]